MMAATAKFESNNLTSDLDHVTRHRMAIFAASAADVVQFTGGLIFDHVGAGWDVRVHITQDATEDERAMRILGIRHLLRSADMDSTEWPDLLLTGAESYRSQPDIHRIFNAAARRQQTEVAMWGGDWPGELDPGIGTVEHRLSTAARAFKAHAVTAAGLDSFADAAEQFVSGKRRFRSAAPLLQPA